MKYLLTRLPILLLALVVGLIVSSSAFGQATIVIEDGDPAGVGFKDTTAATPVGGNTGTTVGAQRLIALQHAASIWGASLSSSPTITIHATWESLTCTTTSGTLASAGNNGSIYNPLPGTWGSPGFWHGTALANALSGIDRNGAPAEINARFNLNIGMSTCLNGAPWYYGLDNNHVGNQIDLVGVALHEFAHGLGFQTFTNSSNGVQISGTPSIYDKFLFDNTAGKTWPQMTDLERQASAKNTRRLAWNGPQVVNDVPSVLALGTPLFRVNSPPLVAGVYPVGTANFGPPLSSPGVTGSLVQALDAADGIGPSTTDGCSVLTNPAAISGNIAMIDRGPTGGTCSFILKVKNAQNAGAIGVVIVNNIAGSPPPGMGGGPDATITIPSLMIALSDGDNIKAQLGLGVNVTLTQDPAVRAGADPSGRALVYTPDPFASGSSVSHWDSSASPNQLMEPNISNDLSHSVTTPQDLTLSLLKDIGWPTGPPPPPPSPTPTPSPPPNDNFVNAQVLAGCSGTVNGTNVAATEEVGEPNHPDSPGSTRSVWYQWQAPSTGSATIDTIGSGYDTLLAVYTGTAVNGLTLVGSNDDIVSGNTASRVIFSATQGTTYRIAVDGFENIPGSGGDTGSITLNWTETPCSQSKVDQTITFGVLSNKTYLDPPFPVSASASSGLPVTFGIFSGPATISGNTITITGVGVVTVRASQSGDANYNAAPTVDQSFTVNKANQTITFNALSAKSFGVSPFPVSASASSGLPVTFGIVSGPATISGNTITITGVGVVTVRASQAGDANYNAATPVDQSFTVNKANQTITFNPLIAKSFGDAPFNVGATASSSLPVSFSIFSGPATISGNTITITGVGVVTVRASQAGDANYNAAPTVDQPFTVGKANQTITFGLLPSKTFGDAPFVVSATASSNLPVTFQIFAGPATMSGNTVTLTGTGIVTVRASQTGNSNYNAAPLVDQSFNVVPANAKISLGGLAHTYDGTAKFASATTNPAGLNVTFNYSQNGSAVTSPTNAGSYDVTATINDPNHQGTTTGTLVINKGTPVITWNNPASLFKGTPLSNVQLNATANVPGNFQYNPIAGTVLSPGTYQISTIFIPSDVANYYSAFASVQLKVVPVLVITEVGTNVALAIDSVTFARGPFRKFGPNNFSADQVTRVMLFTSSLNPSDNPTVQVQGVSLPIERVDAVPGFSQYSYIIVKLVSGTPVGTNLLLTITLDGVTSDAVTIDIGP